MSARPLGNAVWGRRVARLPDRGLLIFATDLQGSLRDYERLKEIYRRLDREGNEPILAFCGDLVHGPSPDMNEPGGWPDYLGTPYKDESAELIRDFERFTRDARSFSLLGNHEHAHIGGPVVPKFHPDEAKVLDEALGPDQETIHAFMRSFPLVAIARCGLVLIHGAPKATEDTLEDFERLSYAGYEHVSINDMYRRNTVGALLWARGATPEEASALLSATGVSDGTEGIVAFGHDIVRSGYEKIEPSQICVSTSYGLFDDNKVYLLIDLSRRYRNVRDLQEGVEILPLY